MAQPRRLLGSKIISLDFVPGVGKKATSLLHNRTALLCRFSMMSKESKGHYPGTEEISPVWGEELDAQRTVLALYVDGTYVRCLFLLLLPPVIFTRSDQVC